MMKSFLILAAGIVLGYKLHDRRDQSIEKITNAVSDKTDQVWAAATDYIRKPGSAN